MSIIYQQDILTITDDYTFDRSLKYMDKIQLSGVSTKLNKQDQITDFSSFTKAYSTSIPYGNYGADVDTILDLTDEVIMSDRMYAQVDYAKYDDGNQIGAYAGYDFNGAKNISFIKIWIGRFFWTTTTHIITIEYLDANGDWNELVDKTVTSRGGSDPYPINTYMIDVNKTIYGIRWIHKKTPTSGDGNNNLVFYGMTMYENNNNNTVCQLMPLDSQSEALKFYENLKPDFEDYNLGRRAGYIQTKDGRSSINTVFAVNTQSSSGQYTVNYRCQTNRKYPGIRTRNYNISTYTTSSSGDQGALKLTIKNDEDVFTEERIHFLDVQGEPRILDGLVKIQHENYSGWRLTFLKKDNITFSIPTYPKTYLSTSNGTQYVNIENNSSNTMTVLFMIESNLTALQYGYGTGNAKDMTERGYSREWYVNIDTPSSDIIYAFVIPAGKHGYITSNGNSQVSTYFKISDIDVNIYGQYINPNDPHDILESIAPSSFTNPNEIFWGHSFIYEIDFSIVTDKFITSEIGFNTNDGVLSTTVSTNIPIFANYDLAYRYLTIGDNNSMAINCKRQTSTDMALLRRVMMPNWRVQSVVNYAIWYSHSIGDRIHYRYDMTTGGYLVRNTDEPVIIGLYRYNRIGDYEGAFVISKTDDFFEHCTKEWDSFNHISPQRLTPLNHPYYVYSYPGAYIYYTNEPGVYIPDMKDQFVGYGNATWYEDTGYNIAMFANKSANGIFYEDGDVDCEWLGVVVDWLLY